MQINLKYIKKGFDSIKTAFKTTYAYSPCLVACLVIIGFTVLVIVLLCQAVSSAEDKRLAAEDKRLAKIRSHCESLKLDFKEIEKCVSYNDKMEWIYYRCSMGVSGYEEANKCVEYNKKKARINNLEKYEN